MPWQEDQGGAVHANQPNRHPYPIQVQVQLEQTGDLGTGVNPSVFQRGRRMATGLRVKPSREPSHFPTRADLLLPREREALRLMVLARVLG
jgi:hypothetical protein